MHKLHFCLGFSIKGSGLFSLFASISLLLNFNTFIDYITTVYLYSRNIFNRHQENICANRKLILPESLNRRLQFQQKDVSVLLNKILF